MPFTKTPNRKQNVTKNVRKCVCAFHVTFLVVENYVLLKRLNILLCVYA
jgi:hypothetical protein